jgi:hypothetical protein
VLEILDRPPAQGKASTYHIYRAFGRAAFSAAGTRAGCSRKEENGTADQTDGESHVHGQTNGSRSIRAGIASEFAAETYGVKVARREIQNADGESPRWHVMHVSECAHCIMHFHRQYDPLRLRNDA